MTIPLGKLPPILREDLDKNLCVCMDVPGIDTNNAIVNGASTVKKVKKKDLCRDGEWLLCSTDRAPN